MQVKISLTGRNNGWKGRSALPMCGKLGIERCFKLVLHPPGPGSMHHLADARSGDLHCPADRFNFTLRLDLTQRANQGIAVLDHDLGMPVPNVIAKLAFNIKRPFRGQRVKTQPKRADGL